MSKLTASAADMRLTLSAIVQCGFRGVAWLAHPLYGVAVLLVVLYGGSGQVAGAEMGRSPGAVRASAIIDTLVTHYEPDESIFPNPERGFYIYSNLLKLDPDIGRRRDEGYTLAWGQIRLRAHRDVPHLPQSFLAAVDSGFNIARDQGMKVIVRGSYGSRGPGGDYTSYQDPPRGHIENHIEQLAPIFAAHADVIALYEAGFIGPWGEWHTTEIAEDYDLGREMLFHILDHTPADRLVLVRNPRLKQQIFRHGSGGLFKRLLFDVQRIFGRSGGGFAVADAGNAYSGERVARVGHHNDCFLSSPDDFGTYGQGEMTQAEEEAYLAGETLYTAFGGETCQPHARNDCGPAIAALEMLKASYLNRGYHRGVLKKWTEQGCFDEVQRRLGARLVMTRSRIAGTARPGGQLAVEVDLDNRGFASLYNARDVEIVLENETSGAVRSFAVDADPRSWKPGGSHAMAATVSLPVDMAPGAYTAYLHLPDPSPRLRDDPRYAYRIANLGVWDGECGYNKLASNIVVEGSE